MMAGQADAHRMAIAEDPEFLAAWEAYKAVTPEAKMHQLPLSAFPISSFHSPSYDTGILIGSQTTPHIKKNSPQEICRAVRSHVRYVPDEIDYWQTLEETWNRRAGDCEDFAIAVRDLCLAQGLDAEIYIFHAKNREAGHAVVIGRWNGIVWMSSNGNYRNIGNIENAQENMIREFQWHFEQVNTYRFTKEGRLFPVEMQKERFNDLHAKSSAASI